MITTPVLLSQIQQIVEVKVSGVRMAPVQTWANVAMVTLGISGALTKNKPMKWLCFGFGMVLGLIIFLIAFLIFHKAIQQFQAVGHEKAETVVEYLRYVRMCFFTSWSVFPILWLISAQGLCIADENIISSIHIPADIVAKNVFGILLWHIKFHLCDGYFDIERFKQRLLQDKLLDLYEDLEVLRQEHACQAEACYWLAGECLSEADDYLRKAAVVDQGLETIRITEEQLQRYHQPTQRAARPSRPARPSNLIAAIEAWWQSPRRRSKNSSGVGGSPSKAFTIPPDQAANQEQIRHSKNLGLKMGKDRLPRDGPREDGAGVPRDSVRRESFDALREQDVRSGRLGFRALHSGVGDSGFGLCSSKTQLSFDGGNGHMGRIKDGSDRRQDSSSDLARRPISSSSDLYFSDEREMDVDARARE
eukprot:Tamp_08831.p1 GENE.Tamp_08831~~Tamp_08831.p1  ORF type:complete len:420 (-),score=36.99 Tamp_08831:417-1676(-)